MLQVYYSRIATVLLHYFLVIKMIMLVAFKLAALAVNLMLCVEKKLNHEDKTPIKIVHYCKAIHFHSLHLLAVPIYSKFSPHPLLLVHDTHQHEGYLFKIFSAQPSALWNNCHKTIRTPYDYWQARYFGYALQAKVKGLTSTIFLRLHPQTHFIYPGHVTAHSQLKN